MSAPQAYAEALAGGPIGRRASNKRTVRKYADKLGHSLGRFQSRHFSRSYADVSMRGRLMYHVATCVRCGDSAFTQRAGRDRDDTNPALDRVCPGEIR